MQTKTSQGSLILPILYLFYNADLLEICDRQGASTSALGFVNDANILAYGKSTKENCWTLEMIHKKYKKLATKHGVVFDLAKYELIHLSQNPKRFNMAAAINIETNKIKPKADIWVLGLQIDTKLSWGPHVQKT